MATDISDSAAKLITRALRKLGATKIGGTVTPAQLAGGMEALSDIAVAWSVEGIELWLREEVEIGLVASSEVTGSDGNLYRCIRNHVSDPTNKPVTGANWSTYWALVTDNQMFVTDEDGNEIIFT